jgi:hypothetical protein
MPAKDGGDSFLVTAAVLEHMLGSGLAARAAASARDDEEQDEDLGEAGDEWMAEQGFDSVEQGPGPRRVKPAHPRSRSSMNDLIIKQTHALIQAGEIAEAEANLVVIAEQEGDHALVEVLDEMAPKTCSR